MTTFKRFLSPRFPTGCGELGTGNSSLPDEAFQASSEFSKDTSASAGRLGSSSAWCARPGDSSMHLQVDLGEVCQLCIIIFTSCSCLTRGKITSRFTAVSYTEIIVCFCLFVCFALLVYFFTVSIEDQS